MIDDLLKGDPLLAFLVKNSNLTTAQMDTLLSYSTAKQNEGSLDDMIRVRDKAVTKGSFLHTLGQARQNLRESVYSILLFGYIGLLNTESIDGLIRVTALLDGFKKTGGKLQYVEIASLIEGLCNRIVPV